MKLMMVAGELSGDTHGGSILQYLNRLIPDLEAFGTGGPRMKAAGLRSVVSMRKLQARGLVEVLRHLPSHVRYFHRVCNLMDREQPDAVMLIDYPGFNLKIAKHAKARGLPVLFYCSPQLWAWRGGRMNAIRERVDKIIVIFPFEVPLYEKAGVDAVFLGHPLKEEEITAEEVKNLRQRLELQDGLPVVAIMPGSRPGELERNLPTVLDGLKLIEGEGYRANFVLPVASTLKIERVRQIVQAGGVKVQIVEDAFLPMLKIADLAIVASGTATLQVGMAGIPFLVVYRVAYMTYRIAKWFMYVKDISIVNILAGRRIVPELLQKKFTPQRVREEFLAIATDPARQAEMRRELAKVTESLGEPGAYLRTAEVVAEFIKSKAGTSTSAADSKAS